jgi:hypothetical protein
MTDQPILPPVRLAFVIDGVVQDIINTDERLAAILLSDPIVIDVTTAEGEVVLAFVGDAYEDGKFSPRS